MSPKKQKPKKIALVTGGGDCPGLNAAIRAVTKMAKLKGIDVYGVEEGFLGLYEDRINLLEDIQVSGILPQGGTILRSSRFNPFKKKTIVNKCIENFKKHDFDGMIVIGGDGSLGVALDFSQKCKLPVIGIPKTIDNDVYGTDLTIGFQTAVQTAVYAIDRLHTTAESHNFIMVLELMGRHCGYLAAYAGLAGGADYILVPEVKTKLDDIIGSLKERQKRGKNFSIVVVAEDGRLYDKKGKVIASTPSMQDEYGKLKLGGIGDIISGLIKDHLNVEVRYNNLGYVQRGGTPVAQDRLMATAFGVQAIDLALSNKWSKLIAWKNGGVVAQPLSIIHKGKKRLPKEYYNMTKSFFK